MSTTQLRLEAVEYGDLDLDSHTRMIFLSCLMAIKVLSTIFVTLCTASLLVLLYFSHPGDPVMLTHPPPRSVPNAPTVECQKTRIHPWDKDVPYGLPVLLLNPSNSSDLVRGNTTNIVNRLYNNLCPGMLSLPKVEFAFPNILLIVDFNEPKYYNIIPYIELLYRRYFPSILYCGLQPERLKKFIVEENLGFPIYYLQALRYTWQVKYECVEHAMKMCDNFTGYLLVGDDTLVNMKTFQRTPKDKMIVGNLFARPGQGMNTTHFHHPWVWWEREGGRNAMLGILNELGFKAHHDNDLLAGEFLRKYYSFVNHSTVFHIMAVDFMYIPKRLSSTFLYLTSLFLKYRANVELAIPFLVCGLQHPGDVHFVTMRSLWGKDRKDSQKYFEKDIVYLHPFKYGEHFNTTLGHEFICRDYLRSE